jgi:site-specific DNA recombinase
VWPPILDRDTWEEVCARLAQRGRSIDITLQRWLTGVLVCSQCGRQLVGWQGNSGPRYWCATPRGGCGKIAAKASAVEDEVERQVLALLTNPRLLEQLRTTADRDTTTAARSELAEDEAQLKELAGAYARREITFMEFREARGIIEQRVRESRALLTSRAPSVLRRLLAGDVREGWAASPAADKREVVLALSAGWKVLPHDRSKGNRFDAARLVPLED